MRYFKAAGLGIVLSIIGLAGYMVYDPLPSMVRHNYTEAELKVIYDRVCKTSGQCNLLPPLTVDPSMQVNAYATSDSITIFQGLADSAENEDQIAMIMGHEMAHFLLAHVFVKDRDIWVTRMFELQADKYGAFLAMRAGYDVCKGRTIFAMFNEKYGDAQDMDHPSNAYRIDQLNVNCEAAL